LDIYEATPGDTTGENNSKIADTHSKIGDKYLFQNDPAQALTHFQKAHEIYEATLGADNSSTVEIYNNIAKAQEAIEQAQAIEASPTNVETDLGNLALTSNEAIVEEVLPLGDGA